MNDPKKSQYASVSYPFPLEEPPVIFCPVCGTPTFDFDDGGNLVINPCQHLAFVFFGRPLEFIYQSKDFQNRISDKDLKDASTKGMKALIETLGYDNKFLSLEVTYGDNEDDPDWYTDIYGFDYSTYC